MKIDYQLIKNILIAIQDYPLPKIDGKELLNKLDIKIPNRRSLETDEDYMKYVTLVYHMEELLKAECIENINKKYQYSFTPNTGSPFVRVDYTSYKLTLKGSKFLRGLKQNEIFNRIKDLDIENAISLITQLLQDQIKKISEIENSISYILKPFYLDLTNRKLDLNTIWEIPKKEYQNTEYFYEMINLYKNSNLILNTPLYHNIIKRIEKVSKKLYKNIPFHYKKAFSDSIDKVFLKLEEDKNLNLKDIDKNEIEEFKNDLYEINKEKVVPLNWQQKIFDVYKKWAEKNPVIAAILSIVVASIISFYLSILLPVRKNANSNSQIINQTTINNITIIGDVKYYYKVQTRDNKGNIINGYVTKRKYNKLKSNKTVEK